MEDHGREPRAPFDNAAKIAAAAAWPTPPAPIPTEREWFDLFREIANHLSYTAEKAKQDLELLPLVVDPEEPF